MKVIRRPFFLLVLAVAVFGAIGAHRLLAQSVTSVTTCRDISASGTYRLDANLSTSGANCLRLSSTNVTIANVTIDGNGKSITVSGGDAVYIADLNSKPHHDISISNFTSNSGITIYGGSVNNISVDNVTISGWQVDGADNTSLTNSTVNGGVHVAELGTNSARNPTLSGNTITGSSDRLVITTGDAHTVGNCDTSGFTITNNTITNAVAVTTNNPVTVFLSCRTNGTFSNNTVTSTGQATGVLIRDGWSSNIFANNTISSNLSVNDSRGAISLVSGSSGGPPNYNTFSNNTVVATNSKALFHYLGTLGNVYQNNLFISNSSVGSSYWDTSSSVTADKTVFSHNTFVNRGSGAALDLFEGVENTIMRDNIFQSDSTNIFTNNSGGNLSAQRSGYVGSRNIFHRRSGSVNFVGVGTFAQWVTATGESNSLSTNPLFVNYTSGDYHLQSSSPARGAGTSGSDIGALPYSVTSCTESWSCGSWSTCSNGSQSRTCTDANACGTIVNRPVLTQSCSTACTESWTCGSWSQCTNSSQSRTCTDGNSCGTTTTRPALTQSCTGGGLSCGSSCSGCTANNILATSCTAAQRQCDGTNTIEDVILNTTSITGGQSLTVDIQYGCYSANPAEDNIALWYYNGSSWRLINYWPAGLSGCDTTPNDIDGTVSQSFTPDSNVGTHYVRAILTAGDQPSDPLSNSSSCPTTMRYGNVDDMAFTVATGTSSCTESWTCEAFSACTNGTQSRTCTDANACGTTADRPALSQSCTVPDTTAPSAVSNLGAS